ncbi:MAG: MerR family transcriptional regulator [Spirochaetes bacterium]|nr:MerR family transcriptional regulator [Spirochaetota bacterium]
MARKNNFLSIGELAKYTGASIDSLRYYERIKLLEPAFTDPYSGYRYYSFDQVYLVEIISLCIELDIPLKELTQFIEEDETLDYSGLLAHGKEIAEKKLKLLQKGLKFIGDIERKIALTEKSPMDGKIYKRVFPQKYFCVTPCESALKSGLKSEFKNAEPFEIIKMSLDLFYYEDNYDEWLYSELLEYGFLCEYTPAKTNFYMFAELPQHIAVTVKERVMSIPAGEYFCVQSKESQIGQAADVFDGHLNGGGSFLAIETNVFTGRYKINAPTNELRVKNTD